MERQKLISYLKKSFLTGSFKTVLVTLSTVILLPLIIQQVGLETYGLIALTMIFGGMVVFADFGISKTVTLLIGQDETKKNVNNIISNALFINICILFFIAIILSLLIYLDIQILGENLKIDNQLKNFIILIGFLILSIMLLNNILTAILESYYLVHYINMGFAISSVFLNLSIYITSLLTDSIYLLIISPLFSFVIVSLYFLLILKNNTNISLKKPSINGILKMFSISFKFLNIGLVNGLVIPLNKYFIVLFTGSIVILAIFDIGIKISLMASSFLNSISQPLFGIFSNIHNKKNEIYNVALKTTLLLFILYIVANIVFYIFGENVITYIDETNKKEIFEVSMVLLIGLTFSSVSEPFYRALLGESRLREAFYLKLLIPIINVLLYLIITVENELYKFTFAYAISVFISSLAIILIYIIKYKKGTDAIK